mmetsp:Transcript_21297/g.53655  ORF Transcript_21297/g.53655 Transcript_21297/m.53655 type:complete len:350 (+) Transcript_21297:197-1246(+)
MNARISSIAVRSSFFLLFGFAPAPSASPAICPRPSSSSPGPARASVFGLECIFPPALLAPGTTSCVLVPAFVCPRPPSSTDKSCTNFGISPRRAAICRFKATNSTDSRDFVPGRWWMDGTSAASRLSWRSNKSARMKSAPFAAVCRARAAREVVELGEQMPSATAGRCASRGSCSPPPPAPTATTTRAAPTSLAFFAGDALPALCDPDVDATTPRAGVCGKTLFLVVGDACVRLPGAYELFGFPVGLLLSEAPARAAAGAGGTTFFAVELNLLLPRASVETLLRICCWASSSCCFGSDSDSAARSCLPRGPRCPTTGGTGETSSVAVAVAGGACPSSPLRLLTLTSRRR